MERYTISDFLAICGGLLGLFLGISLLSIIDLIYFSTLRLFWIFHWSKTKRKEELLERREIEENGVHKGNVTNENVVIRAVGFNQNNFRISVKNTYKFTNKNCRYNFYENISSNSVMAVTFMAFNILVKRDCIGVKGLYFFFVTYLTFWYFV